jgi:hypothetical protein
MIFFAFFVKVIVNDFPVIAPIRKSNEKIINPKVKRGTSGLSVNDAPRLNCESAIIDRVAPQVGQGNPVIL